MKIKLNGKFVEATYGDVTVRASVSLAVVRGVVVPVMTFVEAPRSERAVGLMIRMMRRIGPLHVKRPGRRPVPVDSVGENRLNTLGRLRTLPRLPRL